MRADRQQELRQLLQAVDEAGRRRQRPRIDGGSGRIIRRRGPGGRRTLINWGGNDYLGFARNLQVRNSATRAIRQAGAGSTAARLLAGGLHEHRLLEEGLARFMGCEDALLCGSGFQANCAVLPALAGRHDTIVIDRLAHASLYDGARLAGAQLQRFAHNDLADCQAALARATGRKLLVVESIYSMDGDAAPLAELAALAEAADAWLVVDEAHALGVLGPGGRGLAAALGVQPDVMLATCSKALGASGGVVLGCQTLIDYLVNHARGFLFSTAPVPAASAAAYRSLRLLQANPSLPAELCRRAEQLRQALLEQGWQVLPGPAAILPLMIGSEAEAVSLSEALVERGHYVPAIRPPTVPAGGSRLRLTCSLAHKEADGRKLLQALRGLRS